MALMNDDNMRGRIVEKSHDSDDVTWLPDDHAGRNYRS